MNDFHIVELGHPDPEADPGAVLVALQGVHELHRAEDVARHGNDDQTSPVGVRLAEFVPNSQRENVQLLAVRGPLTIDPTPGANGLPVLRATDDLAPDAVLGAAQAVLPLADNLNAVWDISFDVAAAHRRRGIGRALSEAVDRLARTRGRTILQAWGDADQADPDDTDVLEPRTGGHRITRDGGTQFMLAMGYDLAQADKHSVQHLADYRFDEPVIPDGYRIETWQGQAPRWCWPLLANLQQAMSTDTPVGDFDHDEESWDEARYGEWEDRLLRAHDAIVSLAVHEASGEAAGFSQLIRPDGKPAVVEQWNTLVARAHRGHGLGLVVKQANLSRLAQVWPDAERVHTWNATENDFMWAINQKLGYRTQNIGAGWQKHVG